jgi:hypothetical protein
MNLVVSFDQGVSSLPTGFVSAVNYVVNYFDQLFTNPVTVNIAVGYGEIDGYRLAPNALGESLPGISGQAGYVFLESYRQSRSALLAQNAPGSSTLPSASPAPGQLAMTAAEAKALGLYSSSTGLDGWVGFSSSPNIFSYSAGSAPGSNQYYFIGVVEHEFTEVMGRASFLDQAPSYYSLIDLYRYAAPGMRQLGTGAASYFSIDGGSTNLDNWNNYQTGNNGDLTDWAPSAGYDAFDDNGYPGVINQFTTTDITLMRALGWQTIPPPVVTATNQTVAYNQSIPLTSIFSVGGTGITQYQLWFSYPQGGAPALGTVTNNGAAIPLDQAVTLTSLTGLAYTGGATHGTDEIWLKAFNGIWDATWVRADITDLGIAPPVVTAINQTVAYNQSVPLSSIFSVTGSGITQYQVWFSYPQGGAPALGTVTNNGAAIPLDQAVTLTSLTRLAYTGGATHGTDEIWLKAFDGNWNGGWVQANIIDPGVIAPVVTANNQTVAYNQTVPLTDIFSVSGTGITQYQLWFSWPQGGAPALGTVTNNGTPVPLDQTVTLTSLTGLTYTGSANSGTDGIWLRAFNGNWNGGWVQANINDPGITTAAITVSNQTVGYNQSVPLTSIFSVSGGATQYQIWFSWPEQGMPALGTLTNNGTPILLDQAVTVSSLSGLVYTGSASQGTDHIWLKPFNGTWNNSWIQASISDSGSSAQTAAQTDSSALTNNSSMTGSMVIGAGETVDPGGGFSGKVTFFAETGTLKLDNSSSFAGTVAGLRGQDAIDFADIGFGANSSLGYSPNADNSGGTLSVGDGTHTANIALLGNYIASSFVAASDGHGGTVVYDPPASGATDSNPATLANTQH